MFSIPAAAFAAIALGGAAAAATLTGAGATFPAPVYAKWAEAYRAQTGVGMNYQPIGSGDGIQQIRVRTVDFGASDKPLTPRALADAGLYQFPTLIGGVVPIVNLPGVGPGQLRLSGAVLADIFLGRIGRWSASPIAALNPGLRLPDLPIGVVHRADGSGTSFLFTTYLAMRSPAWARHVGAGDAVRWPIGIGGKGNDGVSAFVKQTIGSIGYVEYAFARRNGAAFALVRNRAGRFPAPAARSFAAAAAGAPWGRAPGNAVLLLDQPGADVWPISATTFILVRRQGDPVRGAAVLRFFDWAYRGGDAAAVALGYVPLPSPVKAMVRGQWAAMARAGGGPVPIVR